MKIINLTQHKASPEQLAVGVVDVEGQRKKDLVDLLNFDEVPSKKEIAHRANMIARIAAIQGAKCAMIGGAPYLMGPLEKALLKNGIEPLYAFSKRVSIEKDGVKSSVFKHLGFVGEV